MRWHNTIMRTFKSVAAILAVVTLGGALAQPANAGCLQYNGPVKPANWPGAGFSSGSGEFIRTAFVRVADEDYDSYHAEITGLWAFKFISKGNSGTLVLIFGGFAMLAYLSRRSAERILEGVRSAELRRVQIERRLTESRLATAQAQIDPRMLFGALEEIRSMYSLAVPHAEQRLEELIQRLQAGVTGHALVIGSGGDEA